MRRTSYGKEKEDGESNDKQPAVGSGGTRAAEKAERRCGAVISAFLSMRHGRVQGMFPIQLLTADGNGREGAFAWILKNWF